MSRIRLAITILVVLGLPFVVTAQESQQTIQRDPQALAILQQSFAAMGGAVPSDSVAAGAVTLTEGSNTEKGGIKILTRGLHQSAEYIQLSDGERKTVYSRLAGNADNRDRSGPSAPRFAPGNQSPHFPLVLVAGALTDPDMALRYFGQVELDGSNVHHIRFWKVFSAQPRLQPFAELTAKDIWIDSATGLPVKLAYEQREAAGAASRILVEVSYGEYRNFGGVLYPLSSQRSLNGTPWAAIYIHTVTTNTGLTETQFALR
jgi:hypothetical protein